MQLSHPARPSTTPPILSIAGGVATGTVLVVAGLTFAYVTFATPLLQAIAGGGLMGSGAGVNGLAASSIAIIAMTLFLAVGAARLASVLAAVRPRVEPRIHPLAVGLPADVVLAHAVDVGDGRPVPDLLIGPFGAAVVRELPSTAQARRQGPYWEARTEDGWLRIESPLDRAARDAERVRRWLSQDDRDYVVRVYAAVVASDQVVARTPTCAVVAAGQLPAWIASLPVQRTLTPGRLAQLTRLVRGR